MQVGGLCFSMAGPVGLVVTCVGGTEKELGPWKLLRQTRGPKLQMGLGSDIAIVNRQSSVMPCSFLIISVWAAVRKGSKLQQTL